MTKIFEEQQEYLKHILLQRFCLVISSVGFNLFNMVLGSFIQWVVFGDTLTIWINLIIIDFTIFQFPSIVRDFVCTTYTKYDYVLRICQKLRKLILKCDSKCHSVDFFYILWWSLEHWPFINFAKFSNKNSLSCLQIQEHI